MANRIFKQTNFSGGEISPKVLGRSEIQVYGSSLKEATNVSLKSYGLAERRNGTKFISEVKNSSHTVRLLKYQLSNSISYIIEAGDQYFRFYKNGERLGAPYEISTPYLHTELSELSYAQFGSVIYFAHPNHAPRKLTRNGDTDWTLEQIVFSPPPTKELGEYPSTTITPASTSGLAVNFTAGANTFLDGDVGRQIINKSGVGRASIISVTSPTVAVCSIIEDFPSTSSIADGDWYINASPRAELDPSGILSGQIINIVAEKLDSSAAQNTFRSTDVGRYLIINNGVVLITNYVSATSVDGVILKSLDTTDLTTIWKLEDPAWSSTRGFPRCVSIYESRLWFAGTSSDPLSIWASEVDIFEGFGVGSGDLDAISVTLSSTFSNQLSWMKASRELVIGSIGAEITIQSGVTPSNIQVNQKARTTYGSDTQEAVVFGDETIFIQSSGTKIRTFRYSFDIDGYSGQNLLFLAEHLGSKIITKLDAGQYPDNNLYGVTATGEIIRAVYENNQQILGWSTWKTNGNFKDLSIIDYQTTSQVYVLVEREINGSTVQYVELVDDGDGTDRLDIYSDCTKTYSNPISISGITKADPSVVTSTSHGLSNGDKIILVDVLGMTEVNNKSYYVANKTTNTFELEDVADRTSIVTSELQWTLSSSGTNEYYLEVSGGGDPSSVLDSVISVYEGGTLMVKGSVGSLGVGEWSYGDNDSLGFNTIYVRLTGGTADPDDKGNGWLTYASGIDSTNYSTYVSGGEVHKLVTTMTGLSHLEGETVQVKVDGANHPDVVVSSGSITINSESYEITVGLKYTTTIETLPISWMDGIMQGRQSRGTRTIIRLHNSAIPTTNDILVPSRNTNDIMSLPVPLTTDLIDYDNVNNWDRQVTYKITYDGALPVNILSIYTVVNGDVK